MYKNKIKFNKVELDNFWQIKSTIFEFQWSCFCPKKKYNANSFYNMSQRNIKLFYLCYDFVSIFSVFQHLSFLKNPNANKIKENVGFRNSCYFDDE